MVSGVLWKPRIGEGDDCRLRASLGAIIMMLLLSHCCDGNKPIDVGWFCASRHLLGSRVAVKRSRQFLMNHPGKIMTTGICLDGASKKD